MRARTWSLAALLALVGLQHVASAEPVRFPLVVDYAMLGAAVSEQLGGDAAGAAVVWGTASGCRSLVLRDVAVDRQSERVRITAGGRARAGFGLLGFCFSPLSWDGYLESLARPHVGLDWKLRLRELDSTVLGLDHQRAVLASRLWDIVREHVEERVGDLAFDMAPPAEAAKALLRDSLPASRTEAALQAIDSLRPVDTQVEDDGIRVMVSIDVPTPVSLGPRDLEPPAGPEEIQRWHAALERWDGFLTFIVKGLGLSDPEPTVRDTLLDILLESRHAVLSALSDAPQPGVDPVRKFFLDSWDRLRVVVREAMRRKEVHDRALRYTAFLAAGDALATLDTVGNGLGLEISADGLRRLARILDPGGTTDPLAYSDDTDQDLRSIFGFHDPESGEPLREEHLDSPVDPGTWWWLGPRAVLAAEVPAVNLRTLALRLDRWVPADAEVESYRDAIGRLLATVADRERARSSLDPRFTEVYGHLVPSVAWQESCWRQFVRRNGTVTYLLSSTGDVGIMQVNRRVWRGFFDVRKLEWDIAYNVGAGAEVLAQLLARYGSREAAEQVDNAARATYSAYNGGPAAYRRYRSVKVARMARAIDRAFWEKYQAMTAGRALDFVLCGEAWGTTPKS